MAEFEANLEEFADLIESLDDLEDDISGAGAVTVGTGVSYGIFLEFGTSKMDPKPFFRPALQELNAEGVEGFIRDNSDLSLADIDEIDEVIKLLGLALQRRIQQIITRKGLIDTGTLRASIVAIPGRNPRDLPEESAFSGFTSENPAPPTAGQAVVGERIQIDAGGENNT